MLLLIAQIFILIDAIFALFIVAATIIATYRDDNFSVSAMRDSYVIIASLAVFAVGCGVIHYIGVIAPRV